MKYFTYDHANGNVKLDRPEILLVREFKALLEPKRNISKFDKKGEFGERAFKEFAYIYLFIDWESPYSNSPEQERHEQALDSSGITEEEFRDELFLAACRKYEELQNANISIRLLLAAKEAVETVIYYLRNVDVNERDEVTGKPIFKTKDLIAEIKGSRDLIASLQELEKQVKKEIETGTKLRGDTEAGFFDMGQIEI